MDYEILGPAGLTSLQGLPQPGRRRFGVPVGGAFDQESYLTACALVRNEPGQLVLEITLVAVSLRFHRTCQVALVGASARLNGRALDTQTSVVVQKGEVLEIGPPIRCRSYLAVATHQDWVAHWKAPMSQSLTDGPLRILPTARWDDALTSRQLEVSMKSNRMGVRLEGFDQTHQIELPSEPTCIGAIQHTPSGELILIGPDGPTIGGYPVVGVVCQADVDRVGQLRPGEQVTLAPIDHNAANTLRGERRQRLSRLASPNQGQST